MGIVCLCYSLKINELCFAGTCLDKNDIGLIEYARVAFVRLVI